MENNIGYGMVDLGLPSGLKWADRNVGAETPEAFGDYFMYGSTTPDTKKTCDWAHAPFNGGQEHFDKEHFNEHKSEWLTDDGTLKPECDAAHVNMGDGWRIPTQAEMRELIDGTNRSVEGNGMRFTAPNGNSIFMPFTGYREGSDVYDVGDYGYAWSSSPDAVYASDSCGLYFHNYGGAYTINYYRYNGFVVRGVC